MTHADWLIHMPRENEKCVSRIHSVQVFLFSILQKKNTKQEKIEEIEVKFLKKKLNEGVEKK